MITLRGVAIGALFAVMVAFWIPHVAFHDKTGRWFPIRKVDKLRSPTAISGWFEDGLRLTDGRIVQLPGFRKLPTKSGALTHIAQRGAEIGRWSSLRPCGSAPRVRE